MEVVGAIASVSQLAAYIQSAWKCLRHLHDVYQASTPIIRSRLEDIYMTLKILDRLDQMQYLHDSSEADVLMPILINIADTAQTLQKWLKQPTVLRQRWALIAHGLEIEEASRSLHNKCHLLVFYFCERNNHALNRLEATVGAQNVLARELVSQKMAPIETESRTTTDIIRYANYGEVSKCLRSSSPEPGSSCGNELSSRSAPTKPDPHLQPSQDSSSQQSDGTQFPARFFSPRSNYPADMPSDESFKRPRNDEPFTRVRASGNRLFDASARVGCTTQGSKRSVDVVANGNDVYKRSVEIANEDQSDPCAGKTGRAEDGN
ncbi:MAG: hypothetical protein M1820_006016 [Bogoriella megaspora]|nr:MAG: hypothetical protein M1820_006016 [Bogoriella megaspora]